MGRENKKQFIAAVILFFFTIQSFAQAHFAIPKYNPTQDIPSYQTTQPPVSDDSLTDSEKLALEQLFQLPLKTVLEIMFLITTLSEKERTLSQQIGEEAVLNRILSGKESDEVKIEIPGIGKAEFNKIGDMKRGRIFTRIIHYGTGVVYNYFDKDIFNRTYLSEDYINENDLPKEELEARRYMREQYQLYQARQLMHTPNNLDAYKSIEEQAKEAQAEIEEFTQRIIETAKNNSPSKNYDKLQGHSIRGRDSVNVFYSSEGIEFVEKLDKATQLKGFKKVTNYWKSIREKPHLPQDYDLAMISTVFQGGATFAVALGLFFMGSGMDIIPTCLSVIWAGIVGINIRTYQNWLILSKSKTTQFMKGILLSLSFNYTFIFINEGIKALNKLPSLPTNIAEYSAVFLGAGLAAISLLTIEGLRNHFHSMTNTLINNWAKNKIAEIPRERTRANMNQNDIKVMGKTVNQGYLESQVASGTGSILKLFDLLNLGRFETAVGNFSWGRIIFIMSGFVAAYFNTWYTEKHDLKGKKVHRQMWEGYKFRITFGTTESQYSITLPIIGIVFNPIAKGLNYSFKTLKNGTLYVAKNVTQTLKDIYNSDSSIRQKPFFSNLPRTQMRPQSLNCSKLFN